MLYLAVTPDEYELPMAVADSPKELSSMVGVSANNISSMIYHKKPGTTLGIKFIKVDVDQEERGYI